MKLPVFLLLLGLLSGCSSFRPVGTTVRNPSRAPSTHTRSTAATPTTRARTQRPRPPRAARPVPSHKETASGPTAVVRNSLVSKAEAYLGIRYKYGGNTPKEGFDCSGFVKYLYNAEGLSIQRVSRDQAKEGRPIDPATAKAGDLVFFRRGANQPVFHVSMIVAAAPGELWVIHPTSSRGVIRENILASSYWRPKIYTVKDLIQ
ncbi:C40 family peptidase [Neolewinella sp.]|uniref:C40 family peptidase n=1 Tax=Neolewinella sp. TaxID=2993543 RepID=UPI003B522127